MKGNLNLFPKLFPNLSNLICLAFFIEKVVGKNRSCVIIPISLIIHRNNQPQMGDQIQNFKDALRNGNLQEVENLLKKGVNANTDDNYGIWI